MAINIYNVLDAFNAYPSWEARGLKVIVIPILSPVWNFRMIGSDELFSLLLSSNRPLTTPLMSSGGPLFSFWFGHVFFLTNMKLSEI